MGQVTRLPPRCPCPACGGRGRSVAAMHYRETRVWDREGYFSGGGVGIGLNGGVGIGVGGGTYSESGKISTRRALVFQEPAPFRLDYQSILIIGVCLAMAIFAAPQVLGTMQSLTAPPPPFLGSPAEPRAAGSMINLQDTLEAIFPYMMGALVVVAPIGGLLVLLNSTRSAEKIMEEEDHLNGTEYPRRLARYNALLYCEGCHRIYDAQGRSRDANELGFSEMLDLDAATPGAA